jgi:hypothetical protein
MADTPNKDEILEAVRGSGYLMEQEVATLFESLAFPETSKPFVQTNRAYEDIEEGKSREIDVWVLAEVVHNTSAKLNVEVEFLCECKNNTSPFVFLGRPQNNTDRRLKPKEYVFPIAEYEKTISEEGNTRTVQHHPAFHHLQLAQHHYFYKQPDRAVQFCKIIRKGKSWEATHGGIYDAIFYPLVKSLLSRRREIVKYQGEWKWVWLFFPIVVLNSDIYYIDATATSPEPKQVQQVTLLRQVKSRNIEGVFAVDFVTLTGLKDFIRSGVFPFVQYVADLAKNSPDLLLQKEIRS